MDDLKVEPEAVADVIINFLRAQPGVYDAFTRQELSDLPADYPFAAEMRRESPSAPLGRVS